MHRGDVVLAVDALDDEAAVLALAGQPVLEDHHRGHHLGALEVGDVVALDAQRHVVEPEGDLDLLERLVARGQVRGALGLVHHQRLAGVAGHGLLEALLVAALRHPYADPAPPDVAQQLLDRLVVGGQPRDQDLARDVVAVGAAVQLEQEVLDQLGRAALLHAVGHPAALAADPAAAHVEDLDRDLERVLGEGDHVGGGPVAEDHRLLLERLLHRTEVVAQPRRALEVERLGGGVHLGAHALDERPRVAADEVAEVVDDRAVVLLADVADAGGGALLDVAEQARPADLAGPLEHAVAARAHREDPEELVDGLADGPGVAVGAEVLGALALRAAPHHHPRELVADRHREPRVGLVVAVLDVVAGVELLDPGVLELECLDLGTHHRPLDAGAARDHRRGALVEADRVLEVRRQAGAQVLRLADVDHPSAGVPEAVDARLRRDRPRRRAVVVHGSGGHAPTLRSGGDGASGGRGGPKARHETSEPVRCLVTGSRDRR